MDKITEITTKVTPRNKETPFIILNYNYFCHASQDLSHPAFVLWCWLASRGNDWEVEIYPPSLRRRLGMTSIGEFHNAMKELVEKKYIIQEGEKWVFYEERR